MLKEIKWPAVKNEPPLFPESETQPRLIQSQSLPLEDFTLSQMSTGKKGLMDSFQAVFPLFSSMTLFKNESCPNMQRKAEVNVVRLVEIPPGLPNMFGKSFHKALQMQLYLTPLPSFSRFPLSCFHLCPPNASSRPLYLILCLS